MRNRSATKRQIERFKKNMDRQWGELIAECIFARPVACGIPYWIDPKKCSKEKNLTKH